MRIYTVHVSPGESPGGLDAEPTLIKEGFCWPAFFLTVIWALWHRLWLVAAGMLLGSLVLTGAGAALGLNAVGATVVTLGYDVLIGYLANDLRRWTLRRRGFRETAAVAGGDHASAEHRYLELATGHNSHAQPSF